MSQMIYIVLALFLVIILSLNMQRGVDANRQQQTLNEAMTPLVGVGTEVLETIGSTSFDRYTYQYGPDHPSGGNPAAPYYCGRISEGEKTQRLTPKASFSACSDPFNLDLTDGLGLCPYIEGFAGDSTIVSRDGFNYGVKVDVRYVDEDDHASESGTQTFAKEVKVRVENPYLYLGDDPTNTLKLEMTRVFTYSCVTHAKYVPYTPSGCPPSPCVTS